MRRTREQRWYDKAVPAKIGTIPMVVRLDLRTKIVIGARVRFQEIFCGPWETGKVSNVEPLRIERW